MKIRRLGAGLAALAAGALILTGCANKPAASATTTAATGGTLTVAETNSFSSFNPNTSNGNTDINSKVITYPTRSWFNYIDGSSFAAGNPGLKKDESFGTYQVVSQDPLTVKYTLKSGLEWSDGQPITADDLVFAWAAQSGHYSYKGADGKAATYFDFAGDTSTLGLTSFPTVSDDDLSVTLTYSTPAADWEVAYAADAPAHVIAKNAGLTDAKALTALLKKLSDSSDGTNAEDPDLKKVADFWNTGYDSTTLPSNSDLYVSDGPYVVKDVVENQSVTLVPNPNYKGDLKAKLDQIVMRTIPDATAAVQALKNGEVDVIAPQASADTLTALKAVSGATVYQGDELSYDHLDLTFNNGGPFDPKTYGGDTAKALAVRQAFLKTVPRKAILDAIITPLKPTASVLNSQLFVPAQSAYADSVKANGSSAYGDAPDIDGAKALLAQAGVTSPTVKIMYNIKNPNRVNEYTLIAASAAQAGFTIVDNGDAAWSKRLGDGTYDATLFGWVNSGVGVSNVPQVFSTKGGSNFNGYSNSDVDSLTSTLITTLDTDKQVDIQKQIDPKLFADAYGLPLFQLVGADAVSSRVGGIDVYNPSQSGVWWNTWDWTVKG